MAVVDKKVYHFEIKSELLKWGYPQTPALSEWEGAWLLSVKKEHPLF